jgi:hypothetical protein
MYKKIPFISLLFISFHSIGQPCIVVEPNAAKLDTAAVDTEMVGVAELKTIIEGIKANIATAKWLCGIIGLECQVANR